MANIILLAICLVAGILLKKTGRFPEATPAVLNSFIIHISLPALAILYIHSIVMEPALLMTAAMAWLLFGIAWLIFGSAGKIFKLDRQLTGALILVAGLGNTSFVGLPMIEAFYGKEQLGVGIIADQFGSFLVLSTLGIFAATLYSSGTVTAKQMAAKILLFPPFQALCIAFALRSVAFPEWSNQVLQKLGGTLTPLALVSVGFQLKLGGIGQLIKPLVSGLAYKLLIGPAAIFLIYHYLLSASGTVFQITVFEAAMAPMITAGIIAIEHDLRPQLVSLLIGIGIPLSFITLYFWHLFLARFA